MFANSSYGVMTKRKGDLNGLLSYLWYEIILKLFVTTDSCDTRKDLTFDSFKQSTTTSRDV